MQRAPPHFEGGITLIRLTFLPAFRNGWGQTLPGPLEVSRMLQPVGLREWAAFLKVPPRNAQDRAALGAAHRMNPHD